MISFLINPERICTELLDATNLEEVQEFLQSSHKPDSGAKCILDLNQREQISRIYDSLDTFGQGFVPIKELVHRFRTDQRGKQLLLRPAVYIPAVNKILPFDRLLYELEQSMLHAPEAERQKLAVISRTELNEYLENYERRDIPSKDRVIFTERLAGKFQAGDIIEIGKGFIQLVKDAYASIPAKKAGHYVRKDDFIQELQSRRDYGQFEGACVREQPYKCLRAETVQQTCDRILQESDEYLDLDEAIEFFTRKGRPLILARKIEQQLRQTMMER